MTRSDPWVLPGNDLGIKAGADGGEDRCCPDIGNIELVESMACISGAPVGNTVSVTLVTPYWCEILCHQPLFIAVISAIWWVLGWYPIRRSFIVVAFAELPADCVQPASENYKYKSKCDKCDCRDFQRLHIHRVIRSIIKSV